MTKRKPRPMEPEVTERRFVIKLDRGTITVLLSLLGALGVSGAGHFLNQGSVDETRTGVGLQVQDTWSETRTHLIKLATSVKTLAQEVEDLRDDNLELKQAITRLQRAQGIRPTFKEPEAKEESEALPEIKTLPEVLPETVPFPKMDRIKAVLSDQTDGS